MDLPTPLSGLRDTVRLDTSERRNVYVVSTPNGSYLRLSESAYQLLRWIDDGLTVEEITSRVNVAQTRIMTSTEVQACCDRLIARIDGFCSSSPRAASAGFTFRLRLVPARSVRTITGVLTPAFSPACVVGLGLVIGLTCVQVLRYHVRADEVAVHLFPALGLALLSLLIHEFGHATACARFGAAPHEIGAGVYFIYPAFYSNVSDAWRLTRWQRVVVDLGGIYFQLLTAAGFVGLYELTGWAPLRASLFLIVGSLVFTLNPFFKFDGYWVISDALGVTNLRDQWRRLAAAVGQRLRSGKREPLPWPPSVTAAVVLCSVVGFGLWARFALNVGPMLWHSADGYARHARPFVLMAIRRPSALTPAAVGSWILQTYLLVCALRMAWQWTLLGERWIARAHRRRVAREGAALAAAQRAVTDVAVLQNASPDHPYDPPAPYAVAPAANPTRLTTPRIESA